MVEEIESENSLKETMLKCGVELWKSHFLATVSGWFSWIWSSFVNCIRRLLHLIIYQVSSPKIQSRGITFCRAYRSEIEFRERKEEIKRHGKNSKEYKWISYLFKQLLIGLKYIVANGTDRGWWWRRSDPKCAPTQFSVSHMRLPNLNKFQLNF